MQKHSLRQVLDAACAFMLDGVPVSAVPYGNGHINETFLLGTENSGAEEHRYIIQTVNADVFPKPEEVMRNIELVTAFLKNKNHGDREVLDIIPSVNGRSYYTDSTGTCWRIYKYISGSFCPEKTDDTEVLTEAGYAFGKFQRDLSDFDASLLFETIKDFHNTKKRYADFLKAVNEDILKRAGEVKDEISFIKERENFYGLLYEKHRQGILPLRVSHNDTKTNNVMLDIKTGKALCVIDLDTVMPGFSVTDFGDTVRYGANTGSEDEKDLSEVVFSMKSFDAIAKGYIRGCKGSFKREEIMLFPEGAKMMTIECGMRFLADYLSGDNYFRTSYPKQNLYRCRTQLKLVKDMEDNWEDMKKTVEKYAETTRPLSLYVG